MSNLSDATVTFLFTDIKASTRLWEEHPELMGPNLARHDALLKEAIEANNGGVLKTSGDGFIATFPAAIDAVNASIRAQLSLSAEPWPAETPFKVRMALHTGPAEFREGDYFGPVLNRAARLMAAAHGGQILLTLVTQELAREGLPEGVASRDLGRHRLKDLVRPEQIFQLIVPGLESEFPPLDTLENHPNNLRLQTTPFIGREKEVAEVIGMIHRRKSRLLTLTGPGGTGKTRLSLQVAADLLGEFSDGAYFVDLSSIEDPHRVLSVLSNTLDVKEEPNQTLLETLKQHFKNKEHLLVLDNFEQVSSAAAALIELIESCPKLFLLVTSRESLHLSGEREYAVPTLSLPGNTQSTSIEELTQCESVRLFIERARSIKSDFAVTHANAPAVAEICRQLDGLPLAIELAAARIRLLTPQAMLQRLGGRLKLLVGGARNQSPRQQTLRGAIDWSYDLLDAGEKRLFQRISMFVGGCSLEAVDRICSEDGQADDSLTVLESLVRKNLVRQTETDSGEPRLHMLETLREYAREKLREEGDEESAAERHAAFYLEWVEEAKQHLEGEEQVAWLKSLDHEQGNLRLALERFQANKVGAGEELRMAAALSPFWEIRGYRNEGRKSLERALSRPHGPEHSAVRAEALNGLARLAFRQHDPRAAILYSQESLKLFRELDDKKGEANSLHLLGLARGALGDESGATSLLEESLSIRRDLGDRIGMARLLISLGIYARGRGEIEVSRRLQEEALPMCREFGDTRGIAIALLNFSDLLVEQGSLSEAEPLLLECVHLYREVGDVGGIAYGLFTLGRIEYSRGDYSAAAARFYENMEQFQKIGDTGGTAAAFSALGMVLAQQNDSVRARALLEEGLSLQRALDQKTGIGAALIDLSIVSMEVGECDGAGMLLEEAGVLLHEAEDHLKISRLLLNKGHHAFLLQEDRQAVSYLEECLRLSRALGLKHRTAEALGLLGRLAADGSATNGNAADGSDLLAAHSQAEESVRLLREAGEQKSLAESLCHLSFIFGRAGRVDQQKRCLREGFTILCRLGSKLGVGKSCIRVAEWAVTESQAERAVRLLGFVDALYESMGATFTPRMRSESERIRASTEPSLRAETDVAAWEEGRNMSFESGIADVREGLSAA